MESSSGGWSALESDDTLWSHPEWRARGIEDTDLRVLEVRAHLVDEGHIVELTVQDDEDSARWEVRFSGVERMRLVRGNRETEARASVAAPGIVASTSTHNEFWIDSSDFLLIVTGSSNAAVRRTPTPLRPDDHHSAVSSPSSQSPLVGAHPTGYDWSCGEWEALGISPWDLELKGLRLDVAELTLDLEVRGPLGRKGDAARTWIVRFLDVEALDITSNVAEARMVRATIMTSYVDDGIYHASTGGVDMLIRGPSAVVHADGGQAG